MIAVLLPNHLEELEICQSTNSNLTFTLRLFRGRPKDPRVYNTPSCDKIVALIVDDFANMDVGRDITVKKCSSELTRLHETHITFILLQYPLMFPYREDGYQENISIRESHSKSKIR